MIQEDPVNTERMRTHPAVLALEPYLGSVSYYKKVTGADLLVLLEKEEVAVTQMPIVIEVEVDGKQEFRTLHLDKLRGETTGHVYIDFRRLRSRLDINFPVDPNETYYLGKDNYQRIGGRAYV